MANEQGNLRNKTFQPKGAQASVGKMMTTTASEGADWNSTNETKEHSHSEKPSGPMGGLNSGS